MNLAKNAWTGFIQVIISAVVIFGIYRYLYAVTSKEDIGVYSILIALTSISKIGEMGVTGSVTKHVAKYCATSNFIDAERIIKTAIVTVGGGLIFLLGAAYPVLTALILKFIPQEGRTLASELLPLCMAAFWMGIIQGVFQAALDGTQNAYVKHVSLIFGNLIYASTTYLFVKNHGIAGILYGQILGIIFNIAIATIFLKYKLKTISIFANAWGKKYFRELIGYGIKFQLITFLVMLGDPLIKMLMGNFAGLGYVGIYEVANKIIMQLRSLILVPLQSLISHSAGISETSPEKISGVYIKSFLITLHFSVIFWFPVFMALPYASEFWLGKYEPDFLFIATALSLSVMFNLVTNPAYFMYMGIGQLKWNTYVHVTSSLITAVFGYTCGKWFGGDGVVVIWACAFGLAGWIPSIAFHREFRIKWSKLLNRELLCLICFSILGIFLESIFYANFRGHFSFYSMVLIALLGWMCLLFYPVLKVFNGSLLKPIWKGN